MLESDGSDKEQVRMIYERAIGNVPPSQVMKHNNTYAFDFDPNVIYPVGFIELCREPYT